MASSKSELPLSSLSGIDMLEYEIYQEIIDEAKLNIAKDPSAINSPLTSEKYTLLHLACICRHIGLVEWIVQQPMVDINAEDIDGRTALCISIVEDDRAIIKALTDLPGISINSFSRCVLREETYYNVTPLFYAIENKQFELAKLLCKLGANVNGFIMTKQFARDADGSQEEWINDKISLLDFFIRDIDVVHLLLDLNAEITPRTIYTSIKAPVSPSVLKLLIQKGAKLDCEYDRVSMIKAATDAVNRQEQNLKCSSARLQEAKSTNPEFISSNKQSFFLRKLTNAVELDTKLFNDARERLLLIEEQLQIQKNEMPSLGFDRFS